jgi:hypothetical protein
MGFQHSEAGQKDYYRTYEIIAISENGLTLQDSSENIIEVDEDPKDYKVGYTVRYDRIRKRLRLNRWQEYEVTDVLSDMLTLMHKSGDTLKVGKDYSDKFEVGDRVRYDSVDKKLKAAK